MLAFFDVLSWGYGAYVYLHVTAPSGRELQKFEAESEGRVEFVAAEDGEHTFCFKNAYTETEVSFWINTETDSALSDVAKEGAWTASYLRWFHHDLSVRCLTAYSRWLLSLLRYDYVFGELLRTCQ